MSLLSKAEVQFLKGRKVVSKSYEYKLKSILKRKIANLMEKEFPLLSSLFPDLDLTKFSKTKDNDAKYKRHKLTKISKKDNDSTRKNTFKAPGPGFEPGSRE